jgi:hypothetical protein
LLFSPSLTNCRIPWPALLFRPPPRDKSQSYQTAPDNEDQEIKRTIGHVTLRPQVEESLLGRKRVQGGWIDAAVVFLPTALSSKVPI